jgi:integrase
MTPLRAALNLAYENGWVASDFAWRTSLKPINRNDNPSVDVARDVYLTQQDRKCLIDAMPPDFAPFIKLMCLLPIRPGSIAKLKVQDFDANQKWLWIAQDKNAKRRKIPLSPSAHRLLMEISRNKPKDSHIFLTQFGKPWNKDLWKKHINRAVVELGLPSSTVLYSVRHSVITDLVQANVPVVSIAKLSGTSVRMIEKYYAKLVPDFAVDALESLNI